MSLADLSRLPADPDPLFGSADRLDLLLRAAHILVIDDEEINRRLISSTLERAGYRHITTLADARDLESLVAAHPPDLVISDLHMPHRDGFDVIRALQPQISAERLPVLVISGDLAVESRNRALALGARDFVSKPFDPTEMILRVRNQLEGRMLYQDVHKQNRALREAIHGRTKALEASRIELLERLAVAAEYRDESTARHTERVGTISGRLADALGRPADEVELIARAAPLHDIGKIGVPDALLRKEGKLTTEEMLIMRTHTTIGAHILANSDAPVLQLAEVIALTHHEQWDGLGYPRGLAGEDIPLPGRIVAAADAFDAMITARPYRRGRPVAEAVAELRRCSGTQFDAAIVAALISIPSLSEFGDRA